MGEWSSSYARSISLDVYELVTDEAFGGNIIKGQCGTSAMMESILLCIFIYLFFILILFI